MVPRNISNCPFFRTECVTKNQSVYSQQRTTSEYTTRSPLGTRYDTRENNHGSTTLYVAEKLTVLRWYI